jgi:hypothetical protein
MFKRYWYKKSKKRNNKPKKPKPNEKKKSQKETPATAPNTEMHSKPLLIPGLTSFSLH